MLTISQSDLRQGSQRTRDFFMLQRLRPWAEAEAGMLVGRLIADCATPAEGLGDLPVAA